MYKTAKLNSLSLTTFKRAKKALILFLRVNVKHEL